MGALPMIGRPTPPAGLARIGVGAVGLALAALVAASVAACLSTRPTGASVTVYAAASLNAALAAAADAYRAAHPGITITVATDSSAALATKIQQSAPADVFLSADLTNAQRLVDLGLAAGPVVPFARDRLVVIVPAGNPAHITRVEDLARRGVKVIAAADTVPITTYANQLVQNVNGSSDADRGFSAGYFGNVVSKEDNVAAEVAKIELGEGDAAIVYATDAAASSKVATVDVPDRSNVVATFGGVVVKASSNGPAAQAFLAWLVAPEGQAVLARFRFLPPS